MGDPGGGRTYILSLCVLTDLCLLRYLIPRCAHRTVSPSGRVQLCLFQHSHTFNLLPLLQRAAGALQTARVSLWLEKAVPKVCCMQEGVVGYDNSKIAVLSPLASFLLFRCSSLMPKGMPSLLRARVHLYMLHDITVYCL